jgi:hypothetical protein
MGDDVESLLASADPRIATIARDAHDLILELYPDAVVSVDGQDVGFGSGTGYKGLAFVVSLHREHVNLGVWGGAGLPDPDGLLEGSGRVHRHVKLRQVQDLQRPELRALLTEALAHRS